MVEHTKGKWFLDECGIYSNIDGNLVFVANAEGSQGGKDLSLEECEANARLIAAVPDLLAACKRYLWQIELGGPKLVKQVERSYTYQVIKEAVEKAELN